MDNLKQLPILGIKRNLPQGTIDGACDELINHRFTDGAWRVIGPHQVLYDDPSYDLIKLHIQDDIDNWIGYTESTKVVVWYNPSTLAVTQTVVTLTTSETLSNILFLKKFMLIVTDKKIYAFLYKESSYILINLNEIELNFNYSVDIGDFTDPAPITEDAGSDAEGVYGKYLKLINDQSKDGYFCGGIYHRVAFRLFDGTYILPTLPVFHQFYNYETDFVHGAGDNFYFQFRLAQMTSSVTFTEDAAAVFDVLKDIIDEVVLFSSQNQQFWDVTEDNIQDLMDTLPAIGNNIRLEDAAQTTIDVSDNFKEDMFDSIAWYKIGQIQMSNLVQQVAPNDDQYTADFDLDMDGFYQDYATREMLTIDNFSHHRLTGNASNIYNDRIELGDTLQTLATPFVKFYEPAVNPRLFSAIIPAGYEEYEADGTLDGKIQILLETTSGTSVVEQEFIDKDLYVFKSKLDSNNKVVFLPNVIGYPDSRAKEIVINIYSGSYLELYRSNLTKSKFDNYAYVVNKNFNKAFVEDTSSDPRIVGYNFDSFPIEFTIAGLPGATILPTADEVTDNNRVQFSEVNNPFVFPAENSNQVGSGIIKSFGTNTEAMGVSQFGQFPIIVFTSKGRWIMEIGTGDVYITRIVPLDGDVIVGYNSSLDLAFGVAYITSEGVKIARGKEVIQISEDVEGLQDRNFIDNENFEFHMNHANLVELIDYVDKIPFKTYLIGDGVTDFGATIGYNKAIDKSEIIVANPNYIYAYVYNIESKVWSKITGQYSLLIPNYPELYAVRQKRTGLEAPYTTSDDVVNMSVEESGSTQFAIITRAISFDNPDRFKVLRRSFARCFMTMSADKYAAMYVFKSDDLVNWYYITGNDKNTGTFKDIWNTHSANSARFYIYVLIGDVSISRSVVNRLNGLEMEYELKMQGKLR